MSETERKNMRRQRAKGCAVHDIGGLEFGLIDRTEHDVTLWEKHTRNRFAEVRLESLAERPRPGKKRLLDEKAEARLIAEACSTAPEGRAPPDLASARRLSRRVEARCLLRC